MSQIAASKQAVSRSANAVCLGLVLSALAGCGNLGLCTNQCPPDRPTHDSFCGCVDWSGLGRTTTPSDRLYSACICGEQDPTQTVLAYFRSRPANYGKLFGQRLKLASNSCEDITACPIVGPNQKQNYMTGYVDLIVNRWTETTNYFSGTTSWSVQGSLVPIQTADAGMAIGERREDPVPRFGQRLLLAAATGASAKLIMTDNPLDCRQLCSDPSSSLCESTMAPADINEQLRSLGQKVKGVRNSGSISARELLTMFGQTRSDCSRSDTVFSGGVFSNLGQNCTLTAKLPALKVTAHVDIPPQVKGTIADSASGLRAEFPYSEARPLVTIDDKDLNAQFGGAVRSAELDAGAFRVETERACIALLAPK